MKTYQPPKKILIKSDDTILEFKRKKEKSKNQPDDLYVYEYITALSKRGVEVEMTEKYIQLQLKNYFVAL